jgi:hypothetical protein
MRGSASCASTTSLNARSVRASSAVKKRIGGTFATRSSTTLRVAASQWPACASTS